MNHLAENHPTVYAGLDIAKATLQLHLQGRQYSLANSPAGHRRLVDLLPTVPGVQVVCEASGGYEQPVVAALQAAQLPVSVVNPARVRAFARAQGRRDKSDPLDATTLTAFGQAMRPAPTPVPDAVQVQLRELVRWRAHLQEQLIATTNRAEHPTSPFVRRAQAKLVRQLQRQLAEVEAELAAALQRAPQWPERVQKLTSLDGVGLMTAVVVVSELAELGQANRRQMVALVGLAPWTWQSGAWEGRRHIAGGRAAARRALYMAALTLARMPHTALGQFYRRLRLAGKPAKVALTAVMRKLLLQMNRLLKPA